MQEQNNIEETVDSIKDYVHTQYELVVLKGSDKLAHFASNLLSYIPIIFLSVLTVSILSFALAFYLNTVLVSEYSGFLIVGGGYFAIVFFVICVRKSLIAKPFRNKIIKELFKKSSLLNNIADHESSGNNK